MSSSAQVINLWVRSALVDPMGTGADKEEGGVDGNEDDSATTLSRSSSSGSLASASGMKPKQRISNIEIAYVTLLNRFLPPTIRILAWSPVSAAFSSRYSCIWRHYKYLFSISPTTPILNTIIDFGSTYRGTRTDAQQVEWKRRLQALDLSSLELDVDLMRDGLARLVGEHDFRNMCKVDPPKQLPTHRRTVVSASIDQLEGEGDDMFVLNLRGGAFVSPSLF